MADLKTSQETPASPLSGTELVRIVQDGVNVAATANQFAVLSTGFAVVNQAYAPNITFDLTPYPGIPEIVIDLTLTGNVTFDVTNGQDAQKVTVRVRQDGTGSRLWTSGSHIRLNNDIPSITLTTTASKLDHVGLRWNGADSKADVLAITKGA